MFFILWNVSRRLSFNIPSYLELDIIPLGVAFLRQGEFFCLSCEIVEYGCAAIAGVRVYLCFITIKFD